MSRIEPYKYLEDDFDGSLERTNLHRRKLQPPKRKPKREEQEVVAALADGAAGEVSFNFTYEASRHEQAWMLEALTGFYDMQWISDVLRQVQGGKEASVYQCQAGPQTGAAYIAAKIYRPRRFRNLKNDFLYREGRSNLDADGNVILDDHLLHAIRKRTEFGRQLMHTSWIEHEYQTLEVLHAAGGDVPQPFARGDNAILMGYIGGDEQAAPTLNSVALDTAEARQLFERVLYNIELMLSLDRIHGDLSAYNILYWDGAITLIDFPQVISPRVNRSALAIFTRDVTRVCEYFARQGVRTDPQRLATRLWTAHHHRLTPELDPHLLDAESEQDLSLWKRQAQGEQRKP